jgi:hypothetical protein
MSLVTNSIPNLINGVSQQPYALRLLSQCEIQENAYSSVVEGLRKRAPTKHRAKIVNAPTGEVFTHTINRDTNERYEVMVGGGDLKVYNLLTGAEIAVAFPNGKAYLSSLDPRSHFKAVTVADFTFILNKGRTVTQASNLSPTRSPEGLVWVRLGAYGTDYKITLNNITVTVSTPDGSTASQSLSIATDKIAADLVSAMQGNTTLNNAFTFTRNGSSIRIVHKQGSDFTISVSDGQGDQAMRVVKGKLQRFTDLPAKGFDGFAVEITGDQNSGFDNYYVAYTNDAGTTTGTWIESLKGGEVIRINRTTMPHALVREANGTFTFKQIEWIDRKVGDLESVPMPSFVGKTINDIFFHRNRLGFVADENVIFSRSGDFYNFFQGSATQIVDTDPIDVAVSHVKVSILQHAVPFNETLLLFSDQTQFQLGSTDLLTPETVSINQTTEFECSLRAKPVGAGRNVYFAVNRGSHTGIREYYVDGETETNDAVDVTSHVPKYIKGSVTKLAVSSNEDVLVCLSEDERNSVYVYKYYYNEQEKLQSSWSKWSFGAGDIILNTDFVESELYLVIRRADGVYIESLSIDPGAADGDFGFDIHLDRRINETQCTRSYSTAADETTITLPYVLNGTDFQIITRHGDARKPGTLVGWTQVSSTVIKVTGNLTKFYFGRSYLMRYRFSTFVLKQEAVGGGEQTVGEGRIQLRKVALQYSNSGYFRVEVQPFRRNKYIYVFSGRVIGSGRNIVGEPATENGKFIFPVMGKNDTITIDLLNDTYLPSAVLSAEWEAMYTTRSRRF